MSRYASSTTVSVERSRAEIEKVLSRYGATSFASGWEDGRAVILFECDGRRMRFVLPLPKKTLQETTRQWEQAGRQRWRALLLVIKAKLEAVESGISTFEQEFLAHIVIPGDELGRTVGTWLEPQLDALYDHGKKMPLLLTGGT